MKKILSLVLAMMMVLSMTTVAFADTFEDVTDATTAKAVEALTTLKIVNGYTDGTFKPEETITRAEMAKLLVVALGNEDIATGAKSSFVDAQNTWYDGYAAVAQSLGITNGTGNGKFEGNRKITYTEVIVMTMRALGYNDRAVNTNRQEVYNPTSYKTAAAKIGVLKNVTVKLNDATRGDVAKMVYNALLCTMVNIDKDGNPIARTHIVGDSNQPYKLINSVALAVTHTVSVADMFQKHPADLTEYLGETVTAYVADTDKADNVAQRSILFVDRSFDNYNNKISKGSMAEDYVTISGNLVSLYFSSSNQPTFDITSSNTRVIINNVVQSNNNATALKIKLMADTNRVNTVKYIAPHAANGNMTTVVIEDINKTVLANAEYIAGKAKYLGMDLPLNTDKTVNFKKVIVTGAVNLLEDIKVNDVVQACYAAGNNIKLYVTRETISGVVTEKAVDDSAYFIDNEKYDANYSSGIQGDFASIGLGYKGTFFLDKDGAIAYADTAVSSNAKYGVVLDVQPGIVSTRFGKTLTTYPQVKMVNAEGKTQIYDLNTAWSTTSNSWTKSQYSDISFLPEVTAGGITSLPWTINGALDLDTGAGEELLVKYTLNDAGKITVLEAVSSSEISNSQNGKKTDARFLADESTLILARVAPATYTLIDLNKLTDANIDYRAVANASNFGWEFVVITNGVTLGSTVKTYAVLKGITNVQNASGNTVSKLTVFVNGETKSFIADANVGSIGNSYNGVDYKTDQVISLEFNTNGTVKTAVHNPGLNVYSTTIATVINDLNGRAASATTVTAINSNGSVISLDTNGDGYADVSLKLSKDVVIYKESTLSQYGYSASVVDLDDIRIMNGTAKVSLYDKDGDGVVDTIFMHK